MAPWAFLLGLCSAPLLAGTDIRQVEGGVAVYLPALNDWKAISKVPFGLVAGDRIRLKPLSKVELTFEDGTWLRASQDAVFRVKQDDETGTAIELESGRVEVSVKRLRDHVFEVFAPGAKVTLRADRAGIWVTPKKVVVIEVTRGLADVAPAVGPAVQVPDEHRLEVPPGKAPGLPMPIAELKRFIQKLPAAPPGATRKYERRALRADPEAGGQARPAKAAPEAALDAEGLGLPKPPPEASAPKLGPESLDLEPQLGAASLGIKEPKAAPPAEALGGKSLGLKDPPPEPRAPPKKALPKTDEPEYYRSRPVPTDISPLMGFKDYGVAQPKARPKPVEARPKAEKKAPARAKPGDAEPAEPEYYRPKKISTDISPLLEGPKK